MTSYKIELHADISADFSEAYIWYEHRANGLGEKFLSAVRAKIEQIAQSPDTYGEKHKKGYRECRVDIFPYLVVYKVYKRKKIVFVSSIHHERKHSSSKYRK
jgi:mRNA-degrading endonuclease RelE of RelBE toxin-antitoxin system